MVLRQGLRLTSIGLVAGLAVAVALTQSLRSLLVGLEPVDGWSVSAALLLVTVGSGLACWWPARRASQLSPLDHRGEPGASLRMPLVSLHRPR